MILYKLEKEIHLWKNQFEDFVLDIFKEHRMERLSIELDGILFRIRYMVKNNKDIHLLPGMRESFISSALDLRSIFGEIMYNFLIRIIGFGNSFSLDDIADILAQDVKIDNVYVKFKMLLISRSKEYLEYVDNTIEDNKPYNIFPDKFFRFYVDSYNDGIAKAYPELFESTQQDRVGTGKDADVFVHNFTFQTGEACSLNCTYCLVQGTKILMSDFSHKNIEEIQVEDEVLGFEEHNEFIKHRSLIPSKVTKLFQRTERGYYKISHPSLRKSIRLTAEHPILTARGKWKQVRDLVQSDGIMVTNFDPDDYYDTNVDDINYIKGYFLAGFIGDGCVITNLPSDGFLRYFMRFAVKDIEMTDRMKKYSKILGFDFSIISFKISEKYDIHVDALYSGKRSEYEKWQNLCEETFSDYHLLKAPEFLMGFLAGFYDAEGHIQGSILRIFNSEPALLEIVKDALRFLRIKFDYDQPRFGPNKVVEVLRILGGSPAIFKFLKSTKQAIHRKGLVNLHGRSMFSAIWDFDISYVKRSEKVYNFETTEHTYISNRLLVHNCYQFNKSPMRMTFDIARKFIDQLLADRYGYINRYNSPAIILEFIGGEPLLEISLTRRIYEYFLDRTYELDHPWFELHRLSICSNGMQYFDEEVQSFFKDYAGQISFNISIDGNKELHDACRIQPNGEGSYDIDMIALNHFNKHYTPERNSKMTLAPENMKYLFESVKNFIENDMKTINLNCIFEEGWNQDTALLEYNELKKVADYVLEKDLENLYIAIFSERQEDMALKSNDGNYCGGLGSMLSLRPNGQFYPCIRYMPSSVGDNVEDLCIGTVDGGMVGREQGSSILKKMDNITRRSQSNDICYNCPIGNDCAWCSALSHTVYGTPGKRPTFICIQMIAEALANVYYWLNLSISKPYYDLPIRKNNVPDEWALLVIDEEELEMLKILECAAIVKKMEYHSKRET